MYNDLRGFILYLINYYNKSTCQYTKYYNTKEFYVTYIN